MPRPPTPGQLRISEYGAQVWVFFKKFPQVILTGSQGGEAQNFSEKSTI